MVPAKRSDPQLCTHVVVGFTFSFPMVFELLATLSDVAFPDVVREGTSFFRTSLQKLPNTRRKKNTIVDESQKRYKFAGEVSTNAGKSLYQTL